MVLCTCGVVHVVMCMSSVMYTLYMWWCVHVYRWCRVHVMLCTCYAGGVVYRWYCVHVVHAVLCACHTCCVVYMWYYVCAWCSRGIMTCVFVVLYSVYVYVLHCT